MRLHQYQLVVGWIGAMTALVILAAKKAQLASDVGDVIVEQPPSGQGATLTIKYRLPRREQI